MRDDQDFSHRIAIIGMAGRFPGAPDVETFWRNLCAGHEALVRYSREDINRAIEAYDHGSRGHLMQQVRSGNWVGAGFRLDDIDKFDAAFFGYTPADAELLDPQQRLFLETAWAALEDAAHVPDAWERPVGVFGGASLSRYFINNIYANRDIIHSERDLTAGIGNEPDYVSNRVAYKLNLTGPAVSVQTACSTSLVAIHLACQSLLAGECDLALAGGVLVMVPGGGYLYREGSMASSDGHIRAFDARAEGTVFSEAGVGIVCLKRLEDALAEGDHIYAVVRGSAVANDGAFKAGYTAPGIDGQVRVVSEALAVAGLGADAVTYVEAHGTGTPLGDPIEIAALTRAFRQSTERRQYCAIGSLKPNVGHLAPAAGVASVIKAALAVKHAVLPPSINYAEPNPRIDFAASPFYVNQALQPWATEGSRVAGVSSFGIGGTNAHVILEQPPEPVRLPQTQRLRLFPLSARTPDALQRQAANLAGHVERHPDLELRDLAHTLRVGRKAFEYRAAAVAVSREDLLGELRAIAKDSAAARMLPAATKVCWMFSGQGSQYAGMGRGLYAHLPEFRARLDECCELLAPHAGLDLRTLLFPAGASEAASAQLNQTRYAQPALFAFEYALARQLQALGLEPHAMLGHSLGEYVAACLAGVFELPQALRLVALRGELMQSMPPGAMLSVALDAEALAEHCDAEICVAALNAPKTCVLSGPHARIEALAERLTQAGIGNRVLHTSHAFHSEMMRPAAERFAAAVERAAPQAPQHRYLSNLTGTWITAEQVRDPQYWSGHLLGTVRFQPALETLLADGTGVFVEVGPGNVLATFARRTIGARRSDAQAFELTRHPQEPADDERLFQRALGKLWAAGQALDWTRTAGEADARRVPLPAYPFARERHWVDAPAAPPGSVGSLGKQEQVERWLSVPSWKRQAAGLASSAQWQRNGCVLLFADDNALTAAIEQELAKLGNPVVRIVSAAQFARDGEQRFQIAPAEPQHYEQLLQALAPAPVAAVVHAWNLTAPSVLSRDNLDVHADRAFYSLLHLVQALNDATFDGRLPLLTLSNEVHEVHADDRLNPAKATLLGVHLCLGYEYPRCNSRNLDFAGEVLTAGAPERLAGWIAAELCTLAAEDRLLVGATEKCVAYRQGYRWLAQFEPAPLPALREPLQLDAARAYVVTGGLGGLGLDCAEFLAERGATKIALLGRSRLPERAEWNAWVNQKPSDPTSRKLTKLLGLEARGVAVEVLQADVADAAEMRGAIAAVKARLGPVGGAVHCAGIAGGGMLQLKTRAAAEQVLRPKLHGLLALHEALSGEPLDFLVLFSSLYAVLGGLGQVDYSAANNFLDAYARNEWLQRGRRVMSVNWGGWSEVGMAAGNAPPLPAGRTLDHPYLFSVRDRSEDGAHYVAFLREDDHWALQEHRIGGRAVLPGTALVELVRAAFSDYRGVERVAFENLYFFRPLAVAPASLVEVSLRFERGADERFRFTVSESSGAAIVSGEAMALHSAPAAADLQSWQASCAQEVVEFGADAPQVLQSGGFLQLGPRWQVIRRIAFGADCLLGELELPAAYAGDLDAFALHPSLLDMATGPIAGHLLARMDLGLSGEYLPFSYTRFEQLGRLSRQLSTHVRLRGVSEDRETIELDIAIAGEGGEEVVRLHGFTLKRVPAAAFASAPAGGDSFDFVDDRIRPQEGREVLGRVLGAAAFQPQWIVSTQELPALMSQIAERANAQGAERTRSRSARAGSAIAPPTNATEEVLVEILAQVLGLDAVGIDDNFFELGGDSVMGIQVVAQAKARGLSMKPAQLFEHQTVARLAQAISASAAASAEPPHAQPQDSNSTEGEISQQDLATLLDAVAA